ncbi:MAG: hypothetical protein U0T84_12980 [Chitinophagales bacterium]
MNHLSNHIAEELKAVAPLLASRLRPHYQAPEGYFAAQREQLLLRIRKEEVADELAAFRQLAALDKGAQDAVPKGYFEGVAPAVMQRIHQSEKKAQPQWQQVLKQRLQQLTDAIQHGLYQPRLALVAAAFTGVIMAGSVFYSGPQNVPQADLYQLSNQEIALYIDQHTDEFDENLLQKGTNDIDVLSNLEENDLTALENESID